MKLSAIAKSFVKLASLSLAFVGLNQVAQAQDQIKVIKAKGNKGIVQFPKNITPKNGDTYTISTGNESFGGGGGDTGGGGGGASTGKRQYAIGLSFGAAKKSDRLGPDATHGSSPDFGFGLDGRLGFNLDGTFELGPELTFSHAGGGTTFGGGAFVEFNFVKNTPGTEIVPGIGIQGFFVHNSAGSAISGDGTLFGKFFVLGSSSTCVRADAGAQYSKPSAGDSTIGFGLSGGLEAYF